jgi:hypothetical protein
MNTREQKGKDIAARFKIVRKENNSISPKRSSLTLMIGRRGEIAPYYTCITGSIIEEGCSGS